MRNKKSAYKPHSFLSIFENYNQSLFVDAKQQRLKAPIDFYYGIYYGIINLINKKVTAQKLQPIVFTGGEVGIRTLGTRRVHLISSQAPSTTRPLLQK